ncbi:hypothetical protein CTI12_AA578590 [Artemisia annua]|uniref:Uncharacterized protein n=1 Tax=Artemisia annua TaxID=35608 RepID=A0A2U1KPT4_ARTAN|nr:hypothetical protein CTI12_AA578590 [Artemisia annua]
MDCLEDTSPRKSGGLGVGSLMDSNQSLLIKWWWRFCKEENALWCKVICSIHGSSGGMLNAPEPKKSSGGPSLQEIFPRLVRLETMPNCLVSERVPTFSFRSLVINTTSAHHLVHPTYTTPTTTDPVIRPISSREFFGLSSLGLGCSLTR